MEAQGVARALALAPVDESVRDSAGHFVKPYLPFLLPDFPK